MTCRAVIDTGSNTVHLLVADCGVDRVERMHDMRIRAGLGAAITGGAAVGEQRTRVVAAAVRRFAEQARRQGATEIVLVGTHAVREAADRVALTRALETAAGVEMRVLSTADEAALCLAGASLEPLPPPPYLMADIGGGSSDLALVGDAGLAWVESLPTGSGALAARWFTTAPPRPREVRAAGAMVHELLAAIRLDGYDRLPELVVTGGSGRRVRRQAGIALHAGHGSSTDHLAPVIERLLARPSKRWPQPLENETRAAITRGGAVILRALIEHWQIPMWRASSYGLREGVLLYRARGWALEAPARLVKAS